MLKDSKVVGFLATSDFEASKIFFETTLGLTLIEDTPFALVFQSQDTSIRIQKTDVLTPPPYTALGWEVGDIVLLTKNLTDRGVQFEQFPGLEQDELGIWSAPGGAKVAWFKDPDGNTLSITQSQ